MDARDTQILAERQAAFLADKRPKQGDVVIFADGTERRMSHVWYMDNGEHQVQTCDIYQGSFYLGKGYMEYSGSLYSAIPFLTFTRTEETKSCRAWFFHRDYAVGGGGIDVMVDCPVWHCSLEANKV